MIHYKWPRAELEKAVDAADQGWRKDAEAKTKALVTAGEFTEAGKDHTWSAVKTVFAQRQGNKCIFCERLLASPEYGKGEHDLEHFRAKKKIYPWPPKGPRRGGSLKLPFKAVAGSEKGYYWLAYELGNYAVACKTCNSGLKGNYFPIVGSRVRFPMPIAELNQTEQPLLLFPLGENGDDPAQFLTFEGIVPKPCGSALDSDPYAYYRAEVTIEFFRLADVKREELLRERSSVINRLWANYEVRLTETKAQDKRDSAKRTIERLLREKEPHSACARSYFHLLESDIEKAWQIHKAAEAYLDSLGKSESSS